MSGSRCSCPSRSPRPVRLGEGARQRSAAALGGEALACVVFRKSASSGMAVMGWGLNGCPSTPPIRRWEFVPRRTEVHARELQRFVKATCRSWCGEKRSKRGFATIDRLQPGSDGVSRTLAVQADEPCGESDRVARVWTDSENIDSCHRRRRRPWNVTDLPRQDASPLLNSESVVSGEIGA